MKNSGNTHHPCRNVLNPKKLHNSKWTSVSPETREKHFVVTKVDRDESGAITNCLIEAVISKRTIAIEWRTLGNSDEWVNGWR